MKDALIGVAIGLIIVALGSMLLYPYYSLTNLKDIAEELEKIRKVIEDKKVTE
jgi:gas vesicle protein